jgi:glycosyltransferase involved in cell wall biosynthesis
MNMDGIEWKRKKWSPPQKAWLWMNEILGGTIANHLVADHPEISKHLQRHTAARKITTIPYGADAAQPMDTSSLQPYGLISKEYYLVIARPEPENSISNIVSAYSRKARNADLVVLGNYVPNSNPYHRKVMEEASPRVRFLGTIYAKEIVRAIRFHAKCYIHGHTVGGTNPSLVEALAAGNAIIAHDNRFNRWVAGESAQYFDTTDSIGRIMDRIEDEPAHLLTMENGSRQRHKEQFVQEDVLASYEDLLLRFAGLGQEAARFLPEMRSEL